MLGAYPWTLPPRWLQPTAPHFETHKQRLRLLYIVLTVGIRFFFIVGRWERWCRVLLIEWGGEMVFCVLEGGGIWGGCYEGNKAFWYNMCLA